MAKQRGKTRSLTQDKDASHDRKKKRTLYAMTGILVFLMVFSIFGIMLSGGDTAGSSDSSASPTDFEGFTFSPTTDGTLPWEISKTPFGKGIFKGEVFSEPIAGNYEVFFHPSVDAVANFFVDAPFVITIVDTKFLLENNTNESTYISLLQAQELARYELGNTFTNLGIEMIGGISAPVEGVQLPVYSCTDAATPTIEFVTTEFSDSATFDGIHIDESNPFCIRVVSSFEEHTLQITERLRFVLIKQE
jgi:hypothetical protein